MLSSNREQMEHLIDKIWTRFLECYHWQHVWRVVLRNLTGKINPGVLLRGKGTTMRQKSREPDGYKECKTKFITMYAGSSRRNFCRYLGTRKEIEGCSWVYHSDTDRL